MKSLLGNSSVPVYLKLQASLILSLTYLGALVFVGGYAAAHGWTLDGLPSIITMLIGTGLTAAMNILSIHLGASTDHAAAQQALAPAPATPAPPQQTLSVPVSVVAAPPQGGNGG